ncbi:hypothetical protein CLAFUW4_10292 [Fulvia fulva]|nr:hypothetical protein CLAFUR4_10296 [Fulvia fulva]KAK4617362.1 hypothetical protein CLAFUR0_10294 [Fulvia fulva]WPV19468.1 hypothetical protein CLAFUW4_10292 [Fulvia fulva]WPV33711.1 hypothetical protein CLAFUW7_10292 [Fulvia fulva]
MTAMFAGPFVPVGYDVGFPFDLSPEEDTLSFPYIFHQGMTQIHPIFEHEASFYTSHSPTSSPGDVANSSPGRDSDQAPAASQGSASLSPAGPIYTPTSTLLEYDDDIITAEDAGFEDASTSPGSYRYSADDYVHVGELEDEMSNVSASVISQPPRQSGATSRPHLALGASQQQLMPTSSRTLQQSQWHCLSTLPPNTRMEDSFVPYTSSAELVLPTASWAEEDLLSGTSNFNTSFTDQSYRTSFGILNDGSLQQLPSTNNGMAFNPQQAVAAQGPTSRTNAYLNAGLETSPTYAGTQMTQQQAGGQFQHPTFAHHNNGHALVTPSLASHPRFQRRIVPSQVQERLQARPLNIPVPQTHGSTTHVSAIRPTRPEQQQSHLDYPSSSRLSSLGVRRRQQASLSPIAPSAIAVQASRPLVKRDSEHLTIGPIRSTQPDRGKRGGRQRNSHLTAETRQKSHAMRKKGACWRCAMQRDQCDHGEPCQRCINRASKGQIQYFECDRSKLPDFVHEFLPPSMTIFHQKQPIEDLVKSQVLRWDKEHQLDLYLSVQYGEPLVWRCYEFIPRTPDIITQYQYFRDHTGQQIRRVKYSPPFGLLKIDTSDDHYFHAYLERLMQPKYLEGLASTIYEEEYAIDPQEVQAQLLHAMCILYLSTSDATLRALLNDILRMLIITYIMGHTLCIVESNLGTVLSSIRHTTPPPDPQTFTSPKLANRQIKFFFSVLRAQIYEKILKWQQQTFHVGGKKETTWIHSFCVMLGFAMVLEESQRILPLTADTEASRGGMSPEDATRQAENAFDRIDDRYKLLIGLFQCKYRDKAWGDNGSFGPHTPRLSEPAQVEFLGFVRNHLYRHEHHFRSRENVTFARNMRSLYTTRQTARFLLPFLTLQGY